MNYCPSCGTANRDGSRFCNECGHKLPSKTGIICPMCSHMNPMNNVYCDNCKARLVPAAPDSPPPAPTGQTSTPASSGSATLKKGLSLPTKPADELPAAEEPSEQKPEAEDDTPDWLLRLRAAAPKASETQPEPPVEPAEPSPAEEIPDWMRPADGEVPDWFQRLSEPAQPRPTQPAPPPPKAAEDLPDWMHELGLVPPAAEAAAIASDAAGASSEEETSDWLQQLRGSVEPPAEPDLTEAPDWLSGFEAPLPVEPEAVAPTPSDWPDQAPSAAVDADLPDWLKELGGESAPPAPAEASTPEPPVTVADEPDWLAAMRAEPPAEPIPPVEEQPAAEPDWLAGLQAQTGSESAEDVTDWLAAIRDETPTPAAEAEAVSDEPDWLAALGGQAQPEASQESVEEAPDWLSRLGEPEAPVAAPEPEPATAPADVPDWLLGMTTPEETESAPTPDDVPDWLHEIGASQAEPIMAESAPPAATPVVAFVEEDLSREDQVATPDWLTNIGEQPSAAPVEEAPPTELPEWLRELGPLPATPGRPEETPFGEGTEVVPGELPEWVRGMQPGQAPPTFADESGHSLTSVIEQPVSDTGLEAAAIPSWLQALRPTETVGLAPEVDGGVAETEGVLAGLQNVLPASLLMGQAHGSATSRQGQIAGVDLARAGLFQELLTRGSLAPTVVRAGPARGLRVSARLNRWVIAFVLIVAVFIPNLAIGEVVEDIFHLRNVDAEAFSAAREQIAALGAGDRVLVTFDYDASQAYEMEPIAEAFLADVFQHRAEVVAVSLNPTGPALANRALKAVGTDGVTVVEQGFLPGQAVGAQNALISGQYDLIVLLAGSPEAARWWIEQVGASSAQTPVVAGLSAGVLPQVQPYQQSGQIKATVTGLIGGLAYRHALDPELNIADERLRRQLELDRLVKSEALYLSQIVFAVVLIAGMLASLIAGMRRAR
ncbi:MAG TPA: zinc ribbon domain-containing protein [Anaerolineae bacterium]|nr:zinc ribbon domain-containing protein [Anaerolineae bacterium]